MIKNLIGASASVAALLAVAPARAQDAGDVNVSIGLSRTKLADKGSISANGVVDPNADYTTRQTFHGTLEVTYFPIKGIAVDASISTPSTTNNVPAGDLKGVPNLGDDQFVTATLGARAQPFSGVISPYVGGGFEMHLTTQVRDGLGVGLKVRDANGPYILGGVALNLTKRWGVFAQVRKSWYATHASGLLPLDATYTSFERIDAKAELDPLVITLGATVRFGNGADSDGGKLALDSTRWTVRAGLTNLNLANKIDLAVGGAPYPGAGLSTFEHHTPTVQVGYFLTPHIALNATLGLPPTIGVYGAGSIGALPKLGDVTYGPVALTLQYHPLRSGRIRPYVGAGLAYLIVFNTKDGSFQNLRVTNALGAAFEAGSDFMITDKLGLFVDIKKALLRPDAYGTFGGASVVGETRLDPWAFTGGVAFHF